MVYRACRFTLEKSLKASSAQPEIREVMDIRQAAHYLGISADSLYRYAATGFIPAFRLGNRWRFRKSRLDEWMDRLPQRLPLPSWCASRRKSRFGLRVLLGAAPGRGRSGQRFRPPLSPLHVMFCAWLPDLAASCWMSA